MSDPNDREPHSARFTDHRPVRPDSIDGKTANPSLNDAESPLSWLRSRRDKAGRPLISDSQYLAGEKLRFDFERAMLASRVTSNWDMSAAGRSGFNPAAEISDGALAARQRYHKALDAVGQELASILVQICCLSAGMEQAERALDLPQRSGKAVLGLALTSLARHYGLSKDAAPSRPKSGQWAMPGYRPSIPELEEV